MQQIKVDEKVLPHFSHTYFWAHFKYQYSSLWKNWWSIFTCNMVSSLYRAVWNWTAPNYWYRLYIAYLQWQLGTQNIAIHSLKPKLNWAEHVHFWFKEKEIPVLCRCLYWRSYIDFLPIIAPFSPHYFKNDKL